MPSGLYLFSPPACISELPRILYTPTFMNKGKKKRKGRGCYYSLPPPSHTDKTSFGQYQGFCRYR
jgi:hypothetical protein